MLAVPARLLLLAAVLAPSAALADAVTYKGTLGDIPIVFELSGPLEEAEEPFAGRYFYDGQSVDIPLQAVAIAPGEVELAEEAPERAELMVAELARCDVEAARKALAEADGSIKVATVMLVKSLSRADADALLVKGQGSLRAALR